MSTLVTREIIASCNGVDLEYDANGEPLIGDEFAVLVVWDEDVPQAIVRGLSLDAVRCLRDACNEVLEAAR